METQEKIILVTGATGHQGGAVARHLIKDGWKVRAISRHPEKPEAQALRNEGIEVEYGDFEDPQSLQKAVEGCYGVFSVQQPHEYGVDAEVKQGIALIDAAKNAGIKHFVYSSVGGAERNTGIPFFESKWKIEQYLYRSGLNWTVFRPVNFMENFLDSRMQDSIYNGIFPMPLNSDMPLQLICVDDIGGFVAMAFKDLDTFTGKALEIAGDELTGREMAQVFSKAIGRQVTYQEIDLDELQSVGAGFEMMYDWLNRKGYAADIEYLRGLYPELKTFEDWAVSSGWHKAAA